MPEAIMDMQVCGKCGADVRKGTTFCYSCGAKIEAAAPVIVEAAAIPTPTVDIPLEPIVADESVEENKLSRAAEQRKKARVGLRRTKEYSWEPAENDGLTILASAIIIVIALIVVALAVWWK